MVKNFIKNPKMAWKDCAKIRGKSNKIHNMVDNVTGEKPISNLFAKKFSDVLNSVESDTSNINKLKFEYDTKTFLKSYKTKL